MRTAAYIAMLLLVIAAVGCLYVNLFVPRVSEAALAASISQSLPVGTSKAKVIEWLESQPSIFIGGGNPYFVHGAEVESGAWAIVKDTGPRWAGSSRIILDFYFNRDGLARFDHRIQNDPFVWGW